VDKSSSVMAQQVAQAVLDWQRQYTGSSSQAVNVVLNQDVLVIRLQGALSPAERAVARDPAAAEHLQEYHRQLFASSSNNLREEIKRITGVAVRDARLEVETMTGAVMQRFATGTVVQVFLLAGAVPADVWSGGSPTKAT
jgi:uncharacterized protein YbcI